MLLSAQFNFDLFALRLPNRYANSCSSLCIKTCIGIGIGFAMAAEEAEPIGAVKDGQRKDSDILSSTGLLRERAGLVLPAVYPRNTSIYPHVVSTF